MCVCVCGWIDFYIIIAFLGEFTTSFVFFFNTKNTVLDSWKRTKKNKEGGRLYSETQLHFHTHT